jgi:hypothetical protein
MNLKLSGIKKQLFQDPFIKSFIMKKILIAAFFSVALSACITTLHPLVTYDKVIADERFIGKWKNDDREFNIQQFYKSNLFKKYKTEIKEEIGKKEKTEKTTEDSVLYSKSYVVEYIKDGIQYDMLGNLIRLNGQLFINFTPIDSRPINDTSRDSSLDPGSSLSTYTIAKVQILNSNTLQIDFINGGFIYNQVKTGHLKIKNERDDLYDTFLITASTQELRQFLEKYGNDSRLYNKENSVTLIRKS